MEQIVLPIVKVPYARYNPDYKVHGDVLRLPTEMLEAEVLTLNLNTGSMRVRFLGKQFNPVRQKSEVVTIDTSVSYFFTAFDIVGKGI